MKPLQHGARINHGSKMGKELFRTEDDEGHIIVSQRGNRRLLSFGSMLEQSCVLMDKPYYLIHEYTQMMLLGLLFVEPHRMSILGLGGGGLVHCLSHFYPQSTINVVEIRRAVIDIAYEWFDLPRLENIEIINDDAMHYMTHCKPASTDLIFSDLYHADGMSACQAQQDFIVACYHALSESGCLVLNFHHKPISGTLLMDTIESFFDIIIVYDSGGAPGEHNAILFCCKGRVAIHQPDMNAQAESLAKRLKMPLREHYRKLEYNIQRR